jgi:hypothetical protein
MRDDMFKVIVERPRRGVGYYRTLPNEYRAAKRFKLDDEFNVDDEYCAKKLPMRAHSLGWERKSFNENLQPLRRFLAKQVGRRWDDVYSEICEHLDASSTVKQHVRDHLTDYVTVKTYRTEDGQLWAAGRWGPSQIYNRDFYVEDGILKSGQEKVANYNKGWKQRKAEELRTWKRVIDGVTYEKDKGIWYRIVETETTYMHTYYQGGGLAPIKRLATRLDVRKWTVNRNDIRDLKLNE